jgi:3-dehydroquinate dehydratase II
MRLSNLRKCDTKWTIAVLSGPSLSSDINAIGRFGERLKEWGESLGIHVEHFQSNHEGKLLEYIHSTAAATNGYIVNPGGLTHVGESLRHALKDARRPVVEVHLRNRNLGARSIFSPSVTCIFSGLGQSSYLGALTALVLALDDPDFLHPDGTGPTNRAHGTPRSLYQ